MVVAVLNASAGVDSDWQGLVSRDERLAHSPLTPKEDGPEKPIAFLPLAFSPGQNLAVLMLPMQFGARPEAVLLSVAVASVKLFYHGLTAISNSSPP